MKKNRFIPYGYTIRDGRTIIERNEAQVIQDIFRNYIEGATLKEIAEDLTSRNIPYTERTSVWDKARIARIIDNARYTGLDEYDQIIDRDTYTEAVNTKIARQRGVNERANGAVGTLRNRVRCASCGSLMTRKVSPGKDKSVSWKCQNNDCGLEAQITDADLLDKVTILMNRVIENSGLLIPEHKGKERLSPIISGYQDDIMNELSHECPSEEYIISRIKDMAGELYRGTQAKRATDAQIIREKASRMKTSENFNIGSFQDLVSYIYLDESGRVTLHTRTETETEKGE